MIRKCVSCLVDAEVPSLHTKYCKNCKHIVHERQKREYKKLHYNYVKKTPKTKPKKIKIKKMTKGDWIVELLKRGPKTKETICAYVKADWQTVRQLMTNMRFKGYNISLNGLNLYEIVKIKCPDCTKEFQTSTAVKNHWGHVHK